MALAGDMACFDVCGWSCGGAVTGICRTVMAAVRVTGECATDSKLDSMRFELFIAARYLRAKRRQAVVGVITLICVIGVAAGVASLIIALAITNGMRRDLQEKLVGSTAHVMLMRVAGDGIRDWRPLLARLRALPHVTAAAPGLYEAGADLARGAERGRAD